MKINLLRKLIEGVFKTYLMQVHLDDIRSILTSEDNSANYKVCIELVLKPSLILAA
jgi:hypothetical protein